MPRPSFVDHIIGNLLVQAALVAWFAFTGYAYTQGREENILLLLASGFMVLWSWAARKRLLDFRKYRAKWREAEAPLLSPAPGLSDQVGEGRRPGAFGRMLAAIGNALMWLVIIFSPPLALDFLWGFFREELPPIHSVVPRWFLGYPYAVAQAILDAYAWLSRPRLPSLPEGINPWLLAAPVGLLGLFLLYRRRQRRRRMPATPQAGAWNGVVQVVVPTPK